MATAKETNVGTTSIFSNEPDIESLPPMAGMPSASCASNAPSRAARGLPQRLGSLRSLSKYSWKVSLALAMSAPVTASLRRDSSTAYTAPWYGENLYISGLNPKDITETVSVSPLSTGILDVIACGGVN